MEYATLFPLDRICGRWKSRGKSPPVRVYREGRTYRIALAYCPKGCRSPMTKITSGSCSPRKGCMYGTARNTNIDKDILIINGHEKNTNSNLPYGLALHRHDSPGAMGDL